MINKNDILKMVKSVARRAEGKADRRLLSPGREWAIGLLFTVVLIIAGAVYDINRFSHFLTIEETLPPSSLDQVDYRHGTMSEVLKQFEAHSQEFERLRGNLVPVSSPVISEGEGEVPSDTDLNLSG